MIFTHERITSPDIEPIELAELKRHLREFAEVTDADEDLTNLIVAAREWAEEYTGRALIDQTWLLTVAAHGHGSTNAVVYSGYKRYSREDWAHWINRREIMLRRSPVIAITSIVSVDSSGVETTINPATYALREANSKWPRVLALDGAAWTSSLFKVQFRAGFADRLGSPVQGAERVPVRFKQAMKLWAEANYDRDPKMMALLFDTAANIIKNECSELRLV